MYLTLYTTLILGFMLSGVCQAGCYTGWVSCVGAAGKMFSNFLSKLRFAI